MRDSDTSTASGDAADSTAADANYTAPQHANAWAAFAAGARPELDRFESAIEQPGQVQRERLRSILAANAETQFGIDYRFSRIRSVEDYQTRVPIADWSDMSPRVERVKAGDAHVLTRGAPFHFERTSGSGSRCKDIPYTSDLMLEFQRALVIWLASLLRACPGVAGPSYWSLSPDPMPPDEAPTGVTIGSVGDAAYLAGSIVERLLPTVIAVDSSSANDDDWRIRTLDQLVREPDLRMLSVWSPTFLLAILNTVLHESIRPKSLNWFRRSLPRARCNALCQAIEREDFSTLWPKLSIISCWADGPSAMYADRLGELFPGRHVVPKGLFATEGVVSTSWGVTALRPVAIMSHFLEFIDDTGVARLVDELEAGKRYRPLLSTSGGLYRYRLGDVVEVDGFVANTPCVRFVGREDHRSDLVGEKLDEAIVSAALVDAGLDAPSILVPDARSQPVRYRLITQSTQSSAAQALEHVLTGVHHYALARRNGQLGAVSSHNVANLSALLHESWEKSGRRSGDVKASSLIVYQEHAETLVRMLSEEFGADEQ